MQLGTKSWAKQVVGKIPLWKLTPGLSKLEKVDPGVHYQSPHYLLQFWRSRRYKYRSDPTFDKCMPLDQFLSIWCTALLNFPNFSSSNEWMNKFYHRIAFPLRYFLYWKLTNTHTIWRGSWYRIDLGYKVHHLFVRRFERKLRKFLIDLWPILRSLSTFFSADYFRTGAKQQLLFTESMSVLDQNARINSS